MNWKEELHKEEKYLYVTKGRNIFWTRIREECQDLKKKKSNKKNRMINKRKQAEKKSGVRILTESEEQW